MYISSKKSDHTTVLLGAIVLLLILIGVVLFIWYGLIQERTGQELLFRAPVADIESVPVAPHPEAGDPMTAKLLQPATAPEIVNSPSADMQAKLLQPMDKSILRQ